MAEGQITWKSRGNKSSATSQGEKEFIVDPLVERKLYTEYRLRSVFGQLSKDVETRMMSDGRRMREMDVSKSAAVMSKTVTNADEVRFTMVQNIKGASTYGDAPVETGDYLSYLHSSMKVNYRHSPAQQLSGDMAKLRAGDLVSGEESEIRTQLAYYWGEEMTFESYRGLLMGQSMDLSISEQDGGVQVDLGRGFYQATDSVGGGLVGLNDYSKQVSCENFFTMNNDGEFVTAPTYGAGAAFETNLTAFEQRIATSITGLDDLILTSLTATPTNATKKATIEKYGMRRGILSDMRDMVIQKRIRPVKIGGKDRWILLMDSKLIRDLQATNGELHDLLKITQQGKGQDDALITGFSTWEIEDFIIVRDPYLDLFRPQFTNANSGAGTVDTEIRYGNIAFSRDPRSNMEAPAARNIALAIVLGDGALLNGNIGGAVKVLYEKGKFEQGAELASKNAFSMTRTRWTPKDGRVSNQKVLNQSSMVCAFYYNSSLTGTY